MTTYTYLCKGQSIFAEGVEEGQAELDQSQAEVRQLKADLFGKRSEMQSVTDRTNDLEDPQDQAKPGKKRGQQPNRPAPKRRDHSHLPAREELIDLSEDAKMCDCCRGLMNQSNRRPAELLRPDQGFVVNARPVPVASPWVPVNDEATKPFKATPRRI